MGQDAIVANGAQQIAVGAANGQVPVSSLPNPTGTGPEQYNSEEPLYSQNIQYDDDGDLLFFVIDGKVFDRDGYMMSPLAVYPNPANTEAYFTWPSEHQGDLLAVLDAQGRTVLEHRLTENGLTRLSLAHLPVGLYQAQLRAAGLSTAFTIQR